LVEINLGPRHQANVISPLTEQQKHANAVAASCAKAARSFPCLANLTPASVRRLACSVAAPNVPRSFFQIDGTPST
jgi:hypothetical protein